MLYFGPAGVPLTCKGSSTLEGLECTKELGLSAFEMEFVRGVKMKKDLAEKVGRKAIDLGLRISSHAPYYVNLCTKDKVKKENTKRHILDALRATNAAKGNVTVVHPGYYQKLSKSEAYEQVKKTLYEIGEIIESESIKTKIGLETMGKFTQFGKLDEIIKLCHEFEFVMLVIDFSHLQAIRAYDLTKESEYIKLFRMLEKELDGYVKNFHAHFQEIEYGDKGEKHHNRLGTKYEPNYKKFIKVCVEQGYGGVVISESPIIEKDAIKMNEFYLKLIKKR